MTTDRSQQISSIMETATAHSRDAYALSKQVQKLEGEIAGFQRQRAFLAGLPASRDVGDTVAELDQYVASLEAQHTEIASELDHHNTALLDAENSLHAIHNPPEEGL